MDPALPPGGLDQIFRQYDAIRIHSTRDDGPAPWEPEEDQVQPTQPDGKLNTPTQPTEITGTLTPMSNDDGKVTVERPAPPQQVLTDATQERPKGKPKSWQSNYTDQLRGEISRRKFLHDLSNPTRSTFAKDEVGLAKAYADTTAPGVYYDDSNRTMYVKGTVPSNLSDWRDDVTKIPVWGDIHDAERTKQAEAAYQNLIRQGKPVDRISGHSLGGSVALQLQKDHDIPISRTFGAPVFDLDNSKRGTDLAYHNARYRHPMDPFSIFDRGATMIPIADPNPHSYGGFSQEFDTPAPYMEYLNPKNQTSFMV